MPPARATIRLPKKQRNHLGKPRRVGVELEMIGIELNDIAELAAEHLGLSITTDGRYRRVLSGDDAGDWVVELDFDLLKRMGQEERNEEDLLDELRDSAEELLKLLADLVVPLELVTPPLPMRRLDEVEELIGLLRTAGAKGTTDSLSYAFAMQFNVEIPSTDADVIRRYLQAFLCLYEWLLVRADINLTRRITSYIDPFPTDYVRKVIGADYDPDLATLIDDYLADNPTRNRALDCLPLFLELDEERVRNVTEEPLIKPRPAFHYRLPDCRIDVPGWGLHVAWDDWLEVEALAADRKRLTASCAAYAAFLDKPLKRWLGDWAKRVPRECLGR
ncbi:MAG TPA: amidoligase family protein [Gammaproteobacteria bacterium]|nr:amidoligase family protein [Gammaproteobacteria bacterium]HRP87206.1 amidoligase family protein [Gammaproteobacteria bacterium]